TTLCEGASLTLDVTAPNATYQWQDNSTGSTFNVTQQGTYWVEVSVNNCSTMDSININFAPGTFEFGTDTIICDGGTLALDATSPYATYVWQDDSTNPTLTVSEPGTYWVVITNSCGIQSDTIDVYNSTPTVELGNDTTLCWGETFTLDVTTPNATYLWQDNSTNPTFNLEEQGTYWVEVIVSNCSAIDTIQIDFDPIPTVELGNDITLCD